MVRPVGWTIVVPVPAEVAYHCTVPLVPEAMFAVVITYVAVPVIPAVIVPLCVPTVTNFVPAAVTVTLFSANTPLPSVAVARMVAVPALTPLTTPVLAFTVATEVCRLLHVTAFLVASGGDTVAVKVVLLPTGTFTAVAVLMVMAVTSMSGPGSGPQLPLLKKRPKMRVRMS